MRGLFASGFSITLFLPLLLVSVAVPAVAGSPAPRADIHYCAAQAEGFLNGRLGFWQQRLGLSDWKVSVVMSPVGDLKPKTLGNVHWDVTKKTATIRVLDAADYHLSCREALTDMEMTVVHELVHLELSSLPRSAASRREEEFAVNRIADALVRLDRQLAAPPPSVAAEGTAASPDTKPEASRSRADALGSNE